MFKPMNIHLSLPRLTPTQRLCIVIAISFSFFAAEISVGFYTRSLALIADAFHYLNDLVGFIVALGAIQISNHGRSPKGFSFGWQRAQLLGAFFNGVFLAALGLSIFLQALERFVSLQKVQQPKLVLIVGAVGLALNLISAAFLHDHGNDHGHGHSNVQQPTASPVGDEYPGVHANHYHTMNTAVGTPGRDLGMLGVFLHVIGDAVNNIGVIISGAAIWFGKTDARYYADPAISMGISFMILATSIPLVKNSGRILLQSSPAGVDLDEVKADLEDLKGVSSVHELHIWRLNQQKTIASAHVVTEDDSLEGFIQRAKVIGECLHQYGVHSYTLQPEPKLLLQATAIERGTVQTEV
ncbi:cation diffusion facilitator family metal ion transporter [Rhizodiscina lignyota]|uniref:Cation diffusion facilitator family metal ion transporter n=1 Tax=Rhizodiscina lignyota TaxID=1504668 RepID=A0A9P4I6E1_9PEZI|nr:cation diffusion facilitator family metal ion transporter [Rhizodiscina lignyota]